jgi:hypothetical protein
MRVPLEAPRGLQQQRIQDAAEAAVEDAALAAEIEEDAENDEFHRVPHRILKEPPPK